MNLRDLSTLERTAAWLSELIEACHPRGRLSSHNPRLVRDVIRIAKALRTSLNTLREVVIPTQKEESHGPVDR